MGAVIVLQCPDGDIGCQADIAADDQAPSPVQDCPVSNDIAITHENLCHVTDFRAKMKHVPLAHPHPQQPVNKPPDMMRRKISHLIQHIASPTTAKKPFPKDIGRSQKLIDGSWFLPVTPF